MKNTTSKISFVLFSKNEEKRIALAIKNFIEYGDVIVLDGGSDDRTKEITEQLGAKFFLRPENKLPFVETQENFEFLKSVIKTDWIYWGYTDNFVPEQLLEEMLSIAEKDEVKLVNIPLFTYLWGDIKNYAHKSYAPFLFHKDYVDFTNNHIHGLGKFTGKEGEKIFLPESEDLAIKHFSSYTLHKFILGHLKYAETEALETYTRGERFSITKTLFAMLRYMYIYGKEGRKNGKLGFLIMLNYAFFRLMTYTKLYELEQNIDIQQVEKKYEEKRTKLLKEFK